MSSLCEGFPSVSPTPIIPCCRKGFVDNITRYGAHVAAGIHRTMKTIVRFVQTTNKYDHIIVCMDDISTCVGCRITPTGSPNLDCIDNNQSSRQTIHHLPVLLLCARAVCGLLVCSCLMHVCAHYTPLAKPDIPREGLTKNQWAQNVRRVAHLHSLNDCGGASSGVPYTPLARAEFSQPVRGTQGFPIPICMCVHACVCFLRLNYPISSGSLLLHGGGHPHVHLASGPLGCFPLWGGMSPLPSP